MRMGLNTFDIDAEMYQNLNEQLFESKRQNQRIFFFLYAFLYCTESKVPEIKKMTSFVDFMWLVSPALILLRTRS